MYAGIPPLEIPNQILKAMVTHCQRESPREACGILAGRAEPRVDVFYPLRNELASSTRYQADPVDLIAAIQDMRLEGLGMLALYHSHPHSSAIPSRVDLELNMYGPMPRIIISLNSRIPEVRIWRLEPDYFEELPWRLLQPAVESGRYKI